MNDCKLFCTLPPFTGEGLGMGVSLNLTGMGRSETRPVRKQSSPHNFMG
jgi:hypothetical protein